MILKTLCTLKKGDKFRFTSGNIIYEILGVSAFFIKYQNSKTFIQYEINKSDKAFFTSVVVVSYSNHFDNSKNQKKLIKNMTDNDLNQFSKRYLLWQYLEQLRKVKELEKYVKQLKSKIK